MTQPAGQRRHVVRVEEHDGTKSSSGMPDYATNANWRTFIPQLAVSIEAVSGGEVFRGRQMVATATALVRCLSTPRTRAIAPKMRLVFGTRKMYVKSNLDRDGRQEEQFIQTGESVNG